MKRRCAALPFAVALAAQVAWAADPVAVSFDPSAPTGSARQELEVRLAAELASAGFLAHAQGGDDAVARIELHLDGSPRAARIEALDPEGNLRTYVVRLPADATASALAVRCAEVLRALRAGVEPQRLAEDEAAPPASAPPPPPPAQAAVETTAPAAPRARAAWALELAAGGIGGPGVGWAFGPALRVDASLGPRLALRATLAAQAGAVEHTSSARPDGGTAETRQGWAAIELVGSWRPRQGRVRLDAGLGGGAFVVAGTGDPAATYIGHERSAVAPAGAASVAAELALSGGWALRATVFGLWAIPAISARIVDGEAARLGAPGLAGLLGLVATFGSSTS